MGICWKSSYLSKTEISATLSASSTQNANTLGKPISSLVFSAKDDKEQSRYASKMHICMYCCWKVGIKNEVFKNALAIFLEQMSNLSKLSYCLHFLKSHKMCYSSIQRQICGMCSFTDRKLVAFLYIGHLSSSWGIWGHKDWLSRAILPNYSIYQLDNNVHNAHIMTHCRFYQAMNNRPSQCFLFKTCGRKVENATFDCVLNQENTLEVEAFVDSATTCETICQKVFSFSFKRRSLCIIHQQHSFLVAESAMWLL